jgi:hypothetical protein
LRVNSKNGKSQLTPKSHIQDKSDRYYFQQAIRSPADQIFISPMDLNIKQGVI